MEAWFDEQQVDGKAVLYFHLRKPATTQPAIPFEFDGPATLEHKKYYHEALAQFEQSKAVVDAIEVEMASAAVSDLPIFDDEA